MVFLQLIESIPIANHVAGLFDFALEDQPKFLDFQSGLDGVVDKVTDLDVMHIVSDGAQQLQFARHFPKLVKEELKIEAPLDIVAEVKEVLQDKVPTDLMEHVVSKFNPLKEHEIELPMGHLKDKVTDIVDFADETVQAKFTKLLEMGASLEEFGEFVVSIADEVREEFSLNYIKMLDQIMDTFSQTMARIQSLIPEELEPEVISEILAVESEKVNYVADKGFSLIEKFYEISDELISAKFSFFYEICDKKPEWAECTEIVEKIQEEDAAMRESLRDNVAISFFFARDVLDTLLKQEVN